MKFINAVISITFGGLSYMLGGFDLLMQTLALVVVIDYLTGLLKGVYNGKLSSNVGYKGIIKKISVFLVIALACAVERIILVETPIREITIFFFISNEGISILENVSEFLPIPPKLKAILAQLKGE